MDASIHHPNGNWVVIFISFSLGMIFRIFGWLNAETIDVFLKYTTDVVMLLAFTTTTIAGILNIRKMLREKKKK